MDGSFIPRGGGCIEYNDVKDLDKLAHIADTVIEKIIPKPSCLNLSLG